MAKRKLSSEVIEQYNTDISTVATEIDTYYSSAETIAKEVDQIIENCELSLGNTLSENYTEFPSSDLNAQLEENVKGIKRTLEEAEEKAKTNDQKLKENITTRSNEVIQLKSIINQYKSKVQSASSLSSPGLGSSLKAIGKAGNIDKIAGVNEGRQKRLEYEIKMDKFLSPEQIEEKIREMYSNLSDEQIKVLREYYVFKNIKNWPQVNQPLSTVGRDAILIYENGQYRIKYVSTSDIDVMKVEGSVNGTFLNPGINSTVDLNGTSNNSGTFGTDLSAGVKGSAISGNIDNVDYSIGNAELKGTASKEGLEVSLGGNMAEFGGEFDFWEDDLSKYVAKINISILAAEIKAGLAIDGIEIKTPGFIGISISGKKVDLIDLDIDL
jgi:sugar-specific transcriptional regulator TrmB